MTSPPAGTSQRGPAGAGGPWAGPSPVPSLPPRAIPPAASPAPPAAAGPELVTCAITRRVSVPAVPPQWPELFGARFPGLPEVQAAALAFTPRARWDAAEGPRPRIVIAPGVIRFAAPDLARYERTANRAADHRAHAVDQAGLVLAEGRELPAAPGREITGWSAKSRARMIATLAALDFTGWQAAAAVPAMVTLTLPGDWLAVAPTGAEFKRLVATFRRRFERAWGYPLAALWKLEFQRRGAPHLHLWFPPPLGRAGELRQLGRRRRRAVGDGLLWREWARAVWADVTDHPDPVHRARHARAGVSTDWAEGMRAIDPRRLAVYFAKHGSWRAKDYQNCTPPEWRAPGDGPGRFWGYWGLRPATAAVELDPGQWAPLARTVRRWARAQGVTRQVAAPRYRGGRPRPAGEVVAGLAGAMLVDAHKRRRRKVRRPVTRLRRGTGFVVVNDAPALALALARVQVMLR